MRNAVLVTYATRYGSTQEVAEEIASTLRASGLTVDIQAMNAVKTLDDCASVVLGAPLYIGRWHKEAHQFLKQYQQPLTLRPIAIFALGPVSTDPAEMQSARDQLADDLATYPWLNPITTEMFVGKYDPNKLTFPFSLLNLLPASPLKKMPAGDFRDWDAIRAWAHTIAVNFRPVIQR